jgi:hypothetical protein
MNLSHIGLTLSLAFGISGAALAQSPVQFVSSTVKAGQPVPHACLSEAKVFQTKLALYPQLKGWTNVIACDELAWQIAFDRRGQNVLVESNYLVDMSGHKELFNGADFMAPKVKAEKGTRVVAVIPATPSPRPAAPVPPATPHIGQ